MLHVYNSLTGQKELFRPIEPNKVRMYVCGITVYDYCHVGHARMLVVFDVVARYIRARGFNLTYVRNITDIEDKIIKRAQENGEDYTVLTERFIQAMNDDATALGLLTPDLEPRATDSIDEIIAMIERLIEHGYAYATDAGDVNYDVSRFEAYGALSNKKLEDLRAGSRVEVHQGKDDPLDFVLWKAAKPGEPNWPSPWGNGRPGWHIECSAMSNRFLGEHFDIHGGGMDLKFPHHENEIAQSEGANGSKFVNYWLHNGFVQVDDEKMSKSLGNFFVLKEALTLYGAETMRMFILSSHYRQPLNYKDEIVQSAKASLTRLYTALRGLGVGVSEGVIPAFRERFEAAMDDDFNTPEALAVLHELAREINRSRDTEPDAAAGLGATLRHLGGVLGLLQEEPEVFLKAGGGDDSLTDEQIADLIGQRRAARDAKDWAEADRVRDLLQAQGIVLEDAAGTTTWRRA